MSDGKRVLYVCHGMYGCDTGCCGYRLCVDDEGEVVVGEFTFDHANPAESPRDFAERRWPEQVTDDVEVRWGKWISCDSWEE